MNEESIEPTENGEAEELEQLRAKYLDYCSAQLADLLLYLTPDEIYVLAEKVSGADGDHAAPGYGHVVRVATEWLAEHKHDANVHLTLARLNLAHEQLDKARAHFNMAIELGAGDEAYLELGQMYEIEGNPRTALAYYKRGMEASLNEDAAPVLANAADDASLDSVVTPGLPEMAAVAEQEADAATPVPVPSTEVEDARVIEHKP